MLHACSMLPYSYVDAAPTTSFSTGMLWIAQALLVIYVAACLWLPSAGLRYSFCCRCCALPPQGVA